MGRRGSTVQLHQKETMNKKDTRPKQSIVIIKNKYGYMAYVRGFGYDFDQFSTDYAGILDIVVRKLLTKR
jgi:hypothetical protein